MKNNKIKGRVKNVNYNKQVHRVYPKTRTLNFSLGSEFEIADLISKLEQIKKEFTHAELGSEEDRWGDFSHYAIVPFRFEEESDEAYKARISELEEQELKKEEKRRIEEESKKAARKQSEENLLRKLALELGYEITLKMETHKLKTLPQFFEKVESGIKNFEVRYNDRDFRVGDVLILEEYDPEMGLTGRTVQRKISYVFSEFGLCPNWVILGFELNSINN